VFSDGQIPQLLAWMAQKESDDGDKRKLFQLAARVADLYDQYLVYRPAPPPHRQPAGRGAARPNPPPLTLLYAAKNTEQNHARVLAAWLAALPVTI
ncbi:exodeoxyribonuclease V subunit gamma, partial [Klebsiella pneumoniae]|uniref:exodeoxyribonuclease V subunit gamma n=1 Tax=Klebsiella pneumoniae TaxID=573 RepID=UPI001C3CEFEE